MRDQRFGFIQLDLDESFDFKIFLFRKSEADLIQDILQMFFISRVEMI